VDSSGPDAFLSANSDLAPSIHDRATEPNQLFLAHAEAFFRPVGAGCASVIMDLSVVAEPCN
jgi:hypothetical protein